MPQKIQPVTILGIETSCDETAISIVRFEGESVSVLGNIVSSQIQLHAPYGGVVPNLAAREHTKNILPVLSEAFAQSKLSPKDIDAIAVTQGPGLIPALLVGTTVARTLSYLWQKPLLGIHHIEGHIYANFIGEIQNEELKIKDKNSIPTSSSPAGGEVSSLRDGGVGARNTHHHNLQPEFPLLALVVSGGHTQLVLMKKHFDYEIIGETQDDAVGEAFDKVARILGLGYPGGPVVSRRAAEITKLLSDSVTQEDEEKNLKSKSKNSDVKCQLSNVNCKISLPRPMLNSPDFNFSFSGLKTAVLYAVQKFRKENTLTENDPLPDFFVNALCKEFQQAAIDVLVKKTIRAAKKFDVKTVILAGGVSANTELRTQLGHAVAKDLPTTHYSLPPIHLSTDNAAMIASAGALRWFYMNKKEQEKTAENWKTLKTFANFSLSTK